jgi:Ca-activated chloride channel homolog
MERLVEEKRKKGIAITVLGFGTGNIQDDKMEIIADHGDGNYAYIDNLLEARKVLVSEFGGTLFTIAKDVKFQIEFNPEKVEYYRLIGYENRMLNDEDFNDDTEDAGEMGSGHSVTALYELIPPGTDERVVSIDPLKYRSNRNDKRDNISGSNEYLTIKVRYKIPGQSTSILFQKPVGILIDDIDNISDNLKFAAAVSEFGMILRNSEYKGDATLGSAAHLAESARGSDEEGYRSEMIRLINLAGDMKIVADKR